MKKLILAGLLMLPMQAAHATTAAEYTQAMDSKCRAEGHTNPDRLMCYSYFLGALDMSRMLEAVVTEQGGEPPFCVFKAKTSADIIRRLWINFIDNNPKYLAEPMYVSYAHMMRHEYQCG